MLDWAEGDPLEVAPRLLGAVLTHGGVSVRLTEVEAYAGPRDPGSHAYRGRTSRNEVMFGPPGHLYVYFVYGMHHCANLVTGPEGDPGAVLLRAGEVVDGVDIARSRRPGSTDRDLARGPARLCRVLDIDLGDNGVRPELAPGEPVVQISRGPRVGLRRAAELPWRFWATDEPTVSTYRPAAARRTGR
ncbi:putative 3-methyladenine DNA glycosylase [Nocardioides flavus (ex Wang et al. 2016)]|uniref:Putative 3-methyladenine DNA glycosylase n=1 Tax=Nocardioides flavus (ex Wang et al. 2016) TaxID=2058780 RepID=A0ABQ3HMY7_9ACTN|nr:DNA-3-methyladenine glycosylase [Nocardioides flavus (ex Wang et al. 2016)]GHE19048.1 putative 3-methyladenine DNA glycosylase [Nocardioides flavus (ex Wang et al. 2016)]